MATCLKEQMRSAVCTSCDWKGYVDTLEGAWRTTCPQGCEAEEGNPRSLRPILHIPFDEALYHELNVARARKKGSWGSLGFRVPSFILFGRAC
jgi:hypothetical protein